MWLHQIPGIALRTDNEIFKVPAPNCCEVQLSTIYNTRFNPIFISVVQAEMQNFTTLIVNMVKKENLLASQGGPIIIAQVDDL